MNNPPILKDKDKKKKERKKIWSTTKADKEFSKWIRERDGKCMRCGTIKNLTCSHFWVRQHSSTRYDPDNCVAVCWMPCHKFHWEKEKQGAYRDFMIKRLGKNKYKELEERSKKTYPRSDAIIDCMKLLNVI